MAENVTGPASAVLAAALADSGIRLAVYLPDSVLYDTEQYLEDDPTVDTFVCAREDEGVGIAIGAWLAGRPAAVLMEGSGIGYSGLVLARAKQQRTPVLVVASHNLLLDEAHDYHAASCLAAEGVLGGLGIPYGTITRSADLTRMVKGAVTTMVGQKTPVGLLIAPMVLGGDA
jgi:sulfopyruvate decarboxylase subunit alpha